MIIAVHLAGSSIVFEVPSGVQIDVAVQDPGVRVVR